MTNKVKGDSLRAVTRSPSVLFLLLNLSITLADRLADPTLSKSASYLEGNPVVSGVHDLGLRSTAAPDMRRQDDLETAHARELGMRQASAMHSPSVDSSTVRGIPPHAEPFPYTSPQDRGSDTQSNSALAIPGWEDSYTQAQTGSHSVNIPNRMEGRHEGGNLRTKELSPSSHSPSPNDVSSSVDSALKDSEAVSNDDLEAMMKEYTGSSRQTGYKLTPLHQTDTGIKITNNIRTDNSSTSAVENTVSTLSHSAKAFPPLHREFRNGSEEKKVFESQLAKDTNYIFRNATDPYSSDRESDPKTDLDYNLYSQYSNKVQPTIVDTLNVQTNRKEQSQIPKDVGSFKFKDRFGSEDWDSRTDNHCPKLKNDTDIKYSSYSHFTDDYSYIQLTDYSPEYCEQPTCYLENIGQDNATLEHEELSISGYKIICNSSVSLTKLSLNMTRSCALNTTELVVTHQMELCVITRFDLHDYVNLTYLSITNTALNYIEDMSFGNLAKLKTLDLRNNQLHILPWRILWPHAISGQELRDISTSGNLLDKHCVNVWMDIWKERRVKEGHRGKEGRGEGEGEKGIGRWQGEEIAQEETDKRNASEGYKVEGKRERENRRERRAHGWTQDTSETSQVLITEDCPSPENFHKGCYLCAASLQIVNETGNGPCKKFFLTCSVSGEPMPHIEWDIPPHLTLLHLEVDRNSSYVISTAKLVLNMTELVRTKQRSPLACVASNEMNVSVEKINIVIDGDLPKNPVVCFFDYLTTSPAVLYFETQAVAPWNATWWFYPCNGTDLRDIKIPLYTHPAVAGSSSGVGYLKFQDTPTTGQYEILLCNEYGSSTKGQYITNRPPNLQPCQVTRPIPIRTEEQSLPPVTSMPLPNRPAIPPCHAPTITTNTAIPTTHVNAKTNTTNKNTSFTYTSTTFDPPISMNATDGAHGVRNTTSVSVGPTQFFPPATPLSMSIVLTIVAGVLVVVIGVTWLLLRNLRWPRDRSNMESDPCPDSPFQINFIGCLCRDEECQKKHEGLHTQELMLISAERLVDNPEYIGNGIVLPSKPQVKVIPRDKVKFVSELGEGAFGRVYLGVMEEARGKVTQVAVKTLKSVGPEARVELEREVELLSNLTHANIVSFYGVCYSSDSMLMVFEYMEHGDLNNYLRSHNEDVALHAGEEATTDPISVMDCLQIALQVAAGMKYLASQHYVHRDLATRNCLVGANLVVKIGDFGMSRDVYTTDYYQFGGRTLLPVRWMPPESILYRRFTIESDIWSFGVVLWEIFTGGKQPWYGYNNQEVITQITGCKVLSCPDRCPPDMYRIMVSCWRQNPQERPSMATLYAQICSLITVEPHVLDYD
ncbi:uncharacterized protein LOC122251810 [Penaeus japonicus]|nr:uncharacterized protein LOC122251810 [Penaeus japonicus]